MSAPPNSILEDSYSEDNYNFDENLLWFYPYPNFPNDAACAQSFKATATEPLSFARFLLMKTGLPSGLSYAALFSWIGDLITGSVGTLLAISDPIDVSTFPTIYELVTFAFSGANQYPLVDGINYFIAFLNPTSGVITEVDFVSVGVDAQNLTADGVMWTFSEIIVAPGGVGWVTAAFKLDLIFYVYASPTLVTAKTVLETNAAAILSQIAQLQQETQETSQPQAHFKV